MNTTATLLSFVLAFAAVTAGDASAAPRPRLDKPIHLAARNRGPTYAMVELSQPATAAVYAQTARAASTARATSDARTQLTAVRSQQAAFASAVERANLRGGAREVYRVQRVMNGILYRTDASNVALLRSMAGVKAVHIVTPKTVDNARSIPFVGVSNLWTAAGGGFHGEGVKVGVIDTGIDYTHANFGGAGTAAAYASNDPSVVEEGSFPTAKVIGGIDFAGTDYDASSADPAQYIPVPDDDPLDEAGHGSHVAGTIAGLGVVACGLSAPATLARPCIGGAQAFAGSYDQSFEPSAWLIGPGAAPQASLVALKVFGKQGSTALDTLALEWAVDPNGDGDFSDHLDVVNLSLGSTYGTPNTGDAVVFTNVVNAGVIVVAAAGNASDAYFISGSPGNTPEVISVAASSVGASPALQVTSPAAVAGLKAQAGSVPSVPATPPVQGNLVATVPADGCDTVGNADAVAGKIAFIVRGGTLPDGTTLCGFADKVTNAQAAGASAVVVYNQAAHGDDLSVTMDLTSAAVPITIPARLLGNTDGTAIAAALGSGPVTVALDDTLSIVDSTQSDQIASFSSRGPARLGNKVLLKPDVAAPGVNIVSTGMGTGTGSATFSGTSMATPLTAGTAALLHQMHPDWAPAQVKALLMNTATHETYVDDSTVAGRPPVGPGRQGAGRIDATKALNDAVLAYDKDFPSRVSVSFDTLDVTGPVTEDRTITLQNTGGQGMTYAVGITGVATSPGSGVTAGTTRVTVPAGGSADVTITLSADPAALIPAHD
ncbi:MAG TPA: S8 family serine peptidase, partial [Myxococcales bacterium]|nr:S8 family serine peptidase [Myxococcales bacterium]